MKKFVSTLRIAIALVLSVFSSGVLPVATAQAYSATNPDDEYHKVYVCKYVGTPGVDERLQTGDNPISTDTNSLRNFTGLGSFFNDQQGRSVAIAWDNGDGIEPSISMCPAPSTAQGSLLAASNHCEEITVSATGILPVGAAVQIKDNGINVNAGTYVAAAGVHTLQLYVNGVLKDTQLVDVAECETPPPPTPETPLVDAQVLPCQENTDSTDAVKVTVTNTSDATGDAVVYTATVKNAATDATVASYTFASLADGASANHTFNGLPAGGYYIVISGDDLTTAESAIFTVNECKYVPPCGNECVPEEEIDICHATGSESHPYQLIRNISVSGVYNGHLGQSHQKGEDIIPPFEYQGHTYSQNWPSGQNILDNNCIVSTEDTDVQALVPCVEDGHTVDVTIRVYNNSDHAISYTVTVEQPDGTGTNHQTASIPAYSSHDFTFSGYGLGTFDYTVSIGERTVFSHNFTTVKCTTPPPPVDVCLNLPGNQAEVPTGYVKDGDNCARVLGETDVCPNIAGTQSTVPAGMVKDTNGNCVAIVTPAGGAGAGQVLGEALPAELPNTGPIELPSPLLSIVAGFFTYLFLNRKNRKAEA